MIQVRCIKCRRELAEAGALVFSPPPPDTHLEPHQLAIKYHVCVECFEPLHRWLTGEGVKLNEPRTGQ